MSTMPQGWAAMPSVSRGNSYKTYAAGWTWSGMNDNIFGSSYASGTGQFGFIISKAPSESQSLSLSVDKGISVAAVFNIEVTNQHDVESKGLKRLHLELTALPYATSSPIPKVGDLWIPSGASWSETLPPPIVWNVSYRQRDPKVPYLWVAEVAVKIDAVIPKRILPNKSQSPSTKTTDKPPWEMGIEPTIDFGTEDFTLGLGKFIGSKKPSELNTALKNGSYAALFNDVDSKSFEIVTNSANDPLESPPPMKVGTATIKLSRAFETVSSTLRDAIQAAVEQVCSTSITINGITFPAYTCKMSGATITKRKHKQSAEWLPRQRHPLGFTYNDLGWYPSTGGNAGDIAINYTKNTLPAFKYVEYYEVSITIAQRNLGWGYALVDKGYRRLTAGGKKEEIRSGDGRQTYSAILEEGQEVDMSEGATNKKVLRLYQVLETGDALNDVVGEMLVDD